MSTCKFKRRASIGISRAAEAALVQLPDVSRRGEEAYYMRGALEEGLFAMAEYYAEHGELPGSFSFRFIPGSRRAVEWDRGMEPLDNLIREIQSEDAQ